MENILAALILLAAAVSLSGVFLYYTYIQTTDVRETIHILDVDGVRLDNMTLYTLTYADASIVRIKVYTPAYGELNATLSTPTCYDACILDATVNVEIIGRSILYIYYDVTGDGAEDGMATVEVWTR